MKLKRLATVLMILTVTVWVNYAACGMVQSKTDFTDFLWWSTAVYGLVYFGPFLLMESCILALITLFERR